MGRPRMYARKDEKDIRISASKAAREKRYREAPDKNPPFMGEVTCIHCGFKVRYKFLRCPECNTEQSKENNDVQK